MSKNSEKKQNENSEKDENSVSETKSMLESMKAQLEGVASKDGSKSSGKSNKVDEYAEVLRELIVGSEGEKPIGSPVRYKDIRDMMTEAPIAPGWPKATGKVKRRLDKIADILYERVGYDVPDEPEKDVVCVDANELVKEWRHKDARRPIYMGNPNKFGDDVDTSLGFEPSGDELMIFALTNRDGFIEKVDQYFDKEPDEEEEPDEHEDWLKRNEERAQWYQEVMEQLEDDDKDEDEE